MRIRDYKTVDERRKALEIELSVDLSEIGVASVDIEQAPVKNCENMIGSIRVPIGVAGPLQVTSVTSLASKNYYLPLATTEGALVASISRGCRAITESGGASVVSDRVGITRAPVFVVKDNKESVAFLLWVEKQYTKLQEITEETSSHLTLLDIRPFTLGRNVYLRFSFDTKDAMGMNMATIACAKAAEYIEQETKIHCVSLSGNLCVDKKPNMLNFIEGRGFSVSADAVIKKDILTSVLKTSLSDILEVGKRKILYGSILSGTIGANAQMANVMAAIFLATGQDIAHVAECATGITTVEEMGGDLYISVNLPDLVVGTVGGGTNLSTQIEALSILGITGGNDGKNAEELSEIIAGAVLAGELSLLASLAEQSLARAHAKLGRGK